MSSARMCDNCRFMFSENDEGWSNMTGNRAVRNQESGKIEVKNMSVDYCPDCTEAMANGTGLQRPQTPVPTPKREITQNGEQNKTVSGYTVRDRDEDHRR